MSDLVEFSQTSVVDNDVCDDDLKKESADILVKSQQLNHLPPSKRFKNYIHLENDPQISSSASLEKKTDLTLSDSLDDGKEKMTNKLLGLADIALQRCDT